MREARLENWSVISTGDAYTPPELRKIRLHGNVYGREGFEDGASVYTSSLTSLSYAKRTATTRSGTHYTLGEPDAKFVAWLAENGKRIEDYEFGEEAK
jgi:hypothetical protein